MIGQHCIYCGGSHAQRSEPCSVCEQCYAFCPKEDGHRWVVAKTEQGQKKEEIKNNETTPDNFYIRFIVWANSSELLSIKPNVSVDNLYEEFNKILKENIRPVDKSKRYLLFSNQDGNLVGKFLEIENLHINNDNEYVLIEDGKRKLIGKDVAVMGT